MDLIITFRCKTIKNPHVHAREKKANHFLLYTTILHVLRTITYVTKTILHDWLVKDNVCLFHSFRKPTIIMIFFSVKKLISSQLLRKSLLFIKNFLKYCPSYSEQYQCAGKANNLLKGTKIKYLTAEKKIVLEASCLCSKCKITLYT